MTKRLAQFSVVMQLTDHGRSTNDIKENNLLPTFDQEHYSFHLQLNADKQSNERYLSVLHSQSIYNSSRKTQEKSWNWFKNYKFCSGFSLEVSNGFWFFSAVIRMYKKVYSLLKKVLKGGGKAEKHFNPSFLPFIRLQGERLWRKKRKIPMLSTLARPFTLIRAEWKPSLS